MTPEELEALIRAELVKRDTARRARIGDPAAYEAADAACVSAIMEAAGYAPTEQAERQVRKGRRAARANEDKALGEAS